MTFHIILAEMLIDDPGRACVPQKRAKNDFSHNFSGNANRNFTENAPRIS
ncbi:hypothetical protein T11_2497 [Trichinella zimbabwensis]|uniref:Uncharacterized protein n=1 Tax=Trichinella zimbabwensis TaxID=268475 RepID=A0A0V1GCE2_9BILA|nr:hypothetical protein T11_2497 [Trichinella zimbabwensis]